MTAPSDAVFREERLQKILSLAQELGRVSVAEMSHRFGVSEATIRRDLRELAARGLLHRTHGGAVLPALPPEPPVVHRMLDQQEAKEKIGRAAASLVRDGESVFLGSGSTTAYVARNLVGRNNLTVVTNALNIASLLASAEGITVVLTGGYMRASELSLVGHIAEQSLREVRVDKVIIGMRAVSLEHGLTNDYLPEVMTDRAIIEMSDEIILVADHTKFGKVASAYVAPIERVTTIVTDPDLDAETVGALERMGIHVILAE